MDASKQSDTGVLRWLVQAAQDTGRFADAESEGAQLVHIRAIQKREALVQEVLRRLRERRERNGQA
jgi:hypothetical protein